MAQKNLLDILADFDDDDAKQLFEESRRRRKSGKFESLTFEVPEKGGEGGEGKKRGGFFGDD